VGRILGIDVGERHIGIAVSTPEGLLAVPLRIIEARGDREDAQAIADIAAAEDVESFVVGHPRSLSGESGRQAHRAETFAQLLRDVSALPVDLWDERLSTRQAERVPSSGKRRRPSRTDDVAAAIVLQAYLDRRRNETA
jgi:putative Holliday junction resolvase